MANLTQRTREFFFGLFGDHEITNEVITAINNQGTVIGPTPAISTNTAIARWTGTSGTSLLNTGITISNANHMQWTSDGGGNIGVDDTGIGGIGNGLRPNNIFLKGGLVAGNITGNNPPYGLNIPQISGFVIAGGAPISSAFIGSTAAIWNSTAVNVIGFTNNSSFNNIPVWNTIDGGSDIYFSLLLRSSPKTDLVKFGADGSLSILQTNGTFSIGSSTVTQNSLGYLINNESLQSVTLVDNTAVPTLVASWNATNFTSIQIACSVTRGVGNADSGIILLSSDGISSAINLVAAELGTTGVTFSTDISGGNVRLLYVTSNTGTDATMKYKVQKWLA